MTGACGSSFINDRFSAYLSTRLKDEDYLEINDATVGSLSKNAIVSFEYDKKQVIDITDPHLKSESI